MPPPPPQHTHLFRNFTSASYISLVFGLTQPPSPVKFQSWPPPIGEVWMLPGTWQWYTLLFGESHTLFFNDTRCFVSCSDLSFHITVACTAAPSENEGKYHQHVKFSGTNRSAWSCCICGNQGKPGVLQSSMSYFHLLFGKSFDLCSDLF